MQKEENELDRYLKSKVEEAHFEFKEIYWQKALEMLDKEEEKKKRPGIWRWFTMIGVLIVVSVGAIFILNKKTSTSREVEKTAMVSDEIGETELNNKKSYTQDSTTEEPVIIKESPTTHELKTHEGTVPNNTLNASPKPIHEAKSPNPQTAIHNKKPSDTKASSQPKPEPASSPAAPNATDAQLKNVRKKINKNDRVLMGGKKGAYKMAKALTEKSIPVQALTNTVILKGQRMQPIDTQILFQKDYRDESIYNPRYRAHLLTYETERIDSVTILTFKPSPEAKQESIQKEVVSDTMKRKNAQSRVFLATGANFNKGFKGNQSTTVSWGAAPYVNAGVEKMIHSNISLSTHIGFTYFNGLNLEKTAVQYKYSFGFDSTKISVKYQRLYQLLLPISVAFHIGKLHTLWGGLGASYVFNTESKVTENKTSKNQKGYLDGITRLDIFSMLGYEYRLHNNLTAQIFWQQGYMNAAQKNFFNINTSNTQTRVSLGLKYYFKRNGN